MCKGYKVRRKGEEEEGVVAPRGDGKTTLGHPVRLTGSYKEEEERWGDGRVLGPQPEGRRSLGGQLVCWDGDKQHPGERMTSCGSRRCWYGDRGRPGGKMNLCGGYGGD